MSDKRVSGSRASRREMVLVTAIAGAVAAAALIGTILWEKAAPPPASQVLTVYKHPQCNCCNKWIDHLEGNGFIVLPRLELKQAERQGKLGVPVGLRACHTAVIDGYVVEGHVPAEDIKRLLRERPAATGLAVPGMPIGSPGMEQGDRHDAYEVLLFDAQGQSSVFARHGDPSSNSGTKQ